MTGAASPGALVILIAPDSFKGFLTSVEVARVLGVGWTRARPRDEILFAPLADGGEGFAEILTHAAGGEMRRLPVIGPRGENINAAYGIVASANRVRFSGAARMNHRASGRLL